MPHIKICPNCMGLESPLPAGSTHICHQESINSKPQSQSQEIEELKNKIDVLERYIKTIDYRLRQAEMRVLIAKC